MSRMAAHVVEVNDDSSSSDAPKVLTQHDRCDRCNAQAYFMAIFESGKLTFCRHHFMRHQQTIEDNAQYVIDQSVDLVK